MLKQWSIEPSFSTISSNQVPELVLGEIFNDPTGVNEDGQYVRISNIQYVLAYSDKIVVATSSCLYELPRVEEDKNG